MTDETSVLATFRDAQRQRLQAIRKIAAVDALSAFQLVANWIDQIARYYNRSTNDKANWRAFVQRFFPVHYHSEREIKRLYDLRGALVHELGTRDAVLTENAPDGHWDEHGDLRTVDIEAILTDCETAWKDFSDAIDADSDLRAKVVARAQGIIQPVLLANPRGAIAASASATGVDLTALGWRLED